MTLGTLIVRNFRRHTFRVTLTAFGIATAILAFNLIVTTVRAWYAGVEASVPNRLIPRHAASLSIHLLTLRLSAPPPLRISEHRGYDCGGYPTPAPGETGTRLLS